MSTGDNFFEAMADAVALRLERMANCSQRLLDIDQAANYLGLTPGALRHKAGVDIPVVKIDSKLRFDRRDLDPVYRSGAAGGSLTAETIFRRCGRVAEVQPKEKAA